MPPPGRRRRPHVGRERAIPPPQPQRSRPRSLAAAFPYRAAASCLSDGAGTTSGGAADPRAHARTNPHAGQRCFRDLTNVTAPPAAASLRAENASAAGPTPTLVGSVALVAIGDVLVDPRARTAPGPVGCLGGLEPSADCGDAQRVGGDVGTRERRQRHKPGGLSDRWHDELVEVVEDGTGEELAQRSGVALIGAAQGTEVPGSVALVNDRRRLSKPDQQEVEHQSPRASVAVKKGVDVLETSVQFGERLGQLWSIDAGERPCVCDPTVHECRHLDPRGRSHPAWERLNVMLAE